MEVPMTHKAFDPAANTEADLAGTSPPSRPADLIAQIARGHAPFPLERPADQQTELARAVRIFRRQRLMRLIARAIAGDFTASREQGGPPDAS
jgi:hypothetical protein